MIDNHTFLSTIFGTHLREDEAVGTCAFTESPDDRRGWYLRTPNDPNHAELIGDKAEMANTYYCISAVKRQHALSRAAGNVTRLFVIPLDDVGTGPGAKVSPVDVPIEPTYKIETSEGNYQYGYVLALPMEDLARAGGIVKAVAKSADEGGSMVAKLMRMPCGKNSKKKYGEPFSVQLREWHPERRFTEAELIAAFNIDEVWLARLKKNAPGEAGGSINDDMYDWLVHDNMVDDYTPNQTGWVTVTCPWAGQHSDDKTVAAYSPVGLGGKSYERFRQFKCLHDHCKDRTWVDVAYWMFNRRFVLGPGSMVFDMMRPNIKPKKLEHFKHWSAPYCYRTDPKKPYAFIADHWLKSVDRVTVEAEGFNPLAERLYHDVMDGGRVFNTFGGMPKFDKTDRRNLIGPILDQLKYLFGEEYENALSFFAYTIHRPAVRIQFALLHISPHHGTGRGWLKQLMATMVGTKHTKSPTLQDFMSNQFNDWIYQSLFCTFDEVRQKSVKFAVQDRLRELITERRMMVNRKYRDPAEMDIYCNLMFLSNHLDALQIPDNDRRLWVVVASDPPRDADWYNLIYQTIEDRDAVAQFYWFLTDYLDVPGFNPNGRAPVSADTKLVRESSKSEMEAELTSLVTGLYRLGVMALYKPHFFELCKELNMPIPPDMFSRNGGGSGKERAKFWAVMSDIGVTRSNRVRPSNAAMAAMPNSAQEGTELLVLDVRTAQSPLETQKALAEAAATNRFLLAGLRAEEDKALRRDLLG